MMRLICVLGWGCEVFRSESVLRIDGGMKLVGGKGEDY